MEQDEIEALVGGAVQKHYDQEIHLLRINANERALCGALAGFLQPLFPQHRVHVEFNRHGIVPKALALSDGDGMLTMQAVFPDIIAHQPGHDAQNLLAIEVKKSMSQYDPARDRLKLIAMREQLGYRHGLAMQLSTGPDAHQELVQWEWV